MWLIILPKKLQKQVVIELHSSKTSGHLGITKTLERVKCRFYWYNMRKDIQHICKVCDVCAARKRPTKHYQGPMKKYVVGAPMERIAIDIMGPLPETEKRNRYILVIADYFTKWTEAVPIPDQEAATVASALIDRFISVFGVPKEIHSDQGTNFESVLFHEICDLLNMEKTRTTPFRPKSDGMVERANQNHSEYAYSFHKPYAA